MDRSVTLSRKPTQPNRDGGSGCYPRVHGENLWRFGRKGGGPITGGCRGTCLVGTGQVVGRGFGGNGRMATVTVERGWMEISRRAPTGRRGNGAEWLGENPSYWKGAGSTSVETVTQRPVVRVEGRRVVVGREGIPALVGLAIGVPRAGSSCSQVESRCHRGSGRVSVGGVHGVGRRYPGVLSSTKAAPRRMTRQGGSWHVVPSTPSAEWPRYTKRERRDRCWLGGQLLFF